MVRVAQYLLYWIAYIPIRFVVGIRIVQQNITRAQLQNNSFILTANHVSRFDPFFLLALPWKLYKHIIPIYFLTNPQIYYKLYLRPFLFLFGGYPLPTSKWTFEQYFESTIEKIIAKKNVMIFPEGQVNYSSERLEISPGLGYLLSKTDAPILPIHIKKQTSPASFANRNSIKLRIKKPTIIKIEAKQSENNIETYQRIADEAFPQVYR